MRLSRESCCSQNRILINGHLANICYHTSPRLIMWPDGIYLKNRSNDSVLKFDDLRSIGEIYTDAFGFLRNFSY